MYNHLLDFSISQTQEEAETWAKIWTSYYPACSVKVEPVGIFLGVFDYNPMPGFSYITIEEGIEIGKRKFGKGKIKYGKEPKWLMDGSISQTKEETEKWVKALRVMYRPGLVKVEPVGKNGKFWGVFIYCPVPPWYSTRMA